MGVKGRNPAALQTVASNRDDLRRLHFINALFAHATGRDLYLANQIKGAITFSLAELEAQTALQPELAAKFDAVFNAAAAALLARLLWDPLESTCRHASLSIL